jgi:HAMP domain-containing protein
LHINQALNDEYGLRWMVSVVLSLTELFKDITAASMRMLGITFGVIIALSAVASLVITYVVIAPLRQLSRQMENVANMDLEELDVKPSRFHELSVMQGFFLDMVQKLKEFRAFLPEAILLQRNETDEIPDESPSHLHCKSSASAPNLIADDSSEAEMSVTSAATGSRHASSSHRESSVSRSGASTHKRRVSIKEVGVLTKRQISVLQVDIRNFHSHLESESVLVGMHSDVVEILTQAVQENHGMCNPMLGDKMVAVWNVKTTRADHAAYCASAALQIDSAIFQMKTAKSAYALEGVRQACTSGLAYFGPMGTKTSRTFTIVSACISKGFMFQKLSKFIPFKVICDQSIQERISYKFLTRVVAQLPMLMTKNETCNEKVFEICAENTTVADEWMKMFKLRTLTSRLRFVPCIVPTKPLPGITSRRIYKFFLKIP